MKKVAIIIVHYKNQKETENTIVSLKSLDTENILFTVYVVNNSQKKLQIPFQVIDNKENLGFSEGCNLGIKKALKDGNQYILLLNSDTLVQNTLLSVLTDSLTEEFAGIVSPKIYFAKGYEFHANRYKKDELGKVLWYAGGKIDWNNVYASHRGVDSVDHGQYDTKENTDFATGCCMLIKRQVFETIGFFDPKYFVYFEDVDFSLRAKKAGFEVIYEPKTHMWHKNALSSDKPGSLLHVYFQTRNRYYFAFKYAPLKTKLHIIKELTKNLYNFDKNIKKAATDALLGRMYKGTFQNL